MTREDLIELDVCEDCIVAIANDDYSGMEDATERDVRAGIETQSKDGYLIADGEELGFSSLRCDCCSALAGLRFRAFVAPHEEVLA